MWSASTCDIELLIAASELTYSVKKNNTISLEDKTKNIISQELNIVGAKKYIINQSIAPKKIGGTGSNAFSAIVLSPQTLDDTSPIVIAFKGTDFNQFEDVFADLHISSTGVAPKRYRDAVYNYYKEVRDKYPNRKIIITGHSLAGNLSQYVGVKAYNTKHESETDGLLEVRTFNTAPITTTHAKIFKTNSNISNHFINYRAQHDLVSKNHAIYHQDGKGYGFYGTMINLTNPNSDHYRAHSLSTLKKLMPENLINHIIDGSNDQLAKEQAIGLLENIKYRVSKLNNNDNSSELKNILEILNNANSTPLHKITLISNNLQIEPDSFTKHIKTKLKNDNVKQQLNNLITSIKTYIINKLHTTIKYMLFNSFTNNTNDSQQKNKQPLQRN